MKKKMLALFLTLVMACSFCVTSCENDVRDLELAAKKAGEKVTDTEKALVKALPTFLAQLYIDTKYAKAKK